MAVARKIQMQHLAWRAGFGETLPVISDWEKRKRKEIVNKVLMGPARLSATPVEVVAAADLPDPRQLREMSGEERKNLRKMNTQGIKDLNVAWLGSMIKSGHPLHEKMSLFWHGHFACRTQNVLFKDRKSVV